MRHFLKALSFVVSLLPATLCAAEIQGKVIRVLDGDTIEAWVYERYNVDESLPALQREAQEQKRGLWADANPVPPWEWRYKHN
ncbi:hypothetical protein ABK488_004563 [Escherichia coli]